MLLNTCLYPQASRKAPVRLLNGVSAVLTKSRLYWVCVVCIKHNSGYQVSVNLNAHGEAAAGARLSIWGGGPGVAGVRKALTDLAARLKDLKNCARQDYVDELVMHIDKLLFAQ